MTDAKKPIESALELFVYGPVGFALEARALLPKMIERGRQQVTGQVGMAKVLGQFAVQQGQVEAGKAFTKAQESAVSALSDLGLLGAPRSSAPPMPADTTPAPAAPAATPRPETAPPPAPEPGPDRGPVAADVATLAIPDYDALAASQVVPRLAGLSLEELEAVRAYETAKRGRKTILNKVAQLQITR